MSKILQAGQTYIYTLTDPLTNDIHYVGKTSRPAIRLQEHIKKAKYSKTHKNNWINSLGKLGVKPVLDIIDIVSNSDCGFWEQYWMDLIKTWGFNLTNVASGGIGGNLGIEVCKLISTKLKGRKFTNETIERMREGARTRKLTDAGRKSLSINRSGIKNPMYGRKRPESSKKYRKIIQFDINLNEIKIWKGIIIASKELNINRCTISDVCNGRKKTAGGYVWKYFEN